MFLAAHYLLLPSCLMPLLVASQRVESQSKCHGMLYSAAQQRYHRQDWQGAQAMFTAALFYSSSLTRGKNARVLATCFLHMGQHQRALDYADVSWQHEPGISCCSIIRIRALLALQQQDQALEELQVLQGCADFHLSHLQVRNRTHTGGCRDGGKAPPAQLRFVYLVSTSLCVKELLRSC
jgi:hypothetical protein